MAPHDPLRTPAIILQIIVRIITRPIIAAGAAVFSWMVRNRWMLFSLFMGCVFVLDRMGVFADQAPEPLTHLMCTQIVIGPVDLYVFECILMSLIVVMILIVYDVVYPTLVMLYQRIVQIGAAITLIGFGIYSKVTGRFSDEFVVLEGQITFWDLVKFAVTILIITGVIWAYVGLKTDQENKVTEMYFGNITNTNSTIEYNSDTKFTINLTTERYGPQMISVSAIIDRAVEPVISSVTDV
jgi:hypothetical protein